MLESAFYKLLSSCDSNTGEIKWSIWLQHTCVEDLKIQALLDLSSITIPKSFSQYYEGSARGGMPREADHCMTSRIFRRKTIDSRFPGSVLTIPSAESPNRRELQYKLGALAVYVHSTHPPTPPALPSVHKCGIEKGTLFTPFLPSSPIKLNTPLPPSANPIAPFPDPRV